MTGRPNTVQCKQPRARQSERHNRVFPAPLRACLCPHMRMHAPTALVFEWQRWLRCGGGAARLAAPARRLLSPIARGNGCLLRRGLVTAPTARDAASDRPRVAVAVSGGVDSSVAAAIAVDSLGPKRVCGVHVRCWDPLDEGLEPGSPMACSADTDERDARRVCHALRIPFHVVDFVKEYWTDVFE